MNSTNNTLAAYEQMTRALRGLIATGHAVGVPSAFLADLDQIITTTEVSIENGTLPFITSTNETGAAAPDKEDVKSLARWLWNRGFGSSEGNGFDAGHRDKLMNGAGVPTVPGTWERAMILIAKVETKLEQEPGLAAGVRHNLDEHEQWLPTTAPTVDPFKNGPKAEANRKAKAKILARWLWDRNIDADMLLGFTPKYRREIARAAGTNPPSTLDTWEVALGMIAKMEVRAQANPGDPAVVRHHQDEQLQWSTDPHLAKAA